MLVLFWAGRLVLMLFAFFVFACAAYFLREVIHEKFDPQRQQDTTRQAGLSGFPPAGSVDGRASGI